MISSDGQTFECKDRRASRIPVRACVKKHPGLGNLAERLQLLSGAASTAVAAHTPRPRTGLAHSRNSFARPRNSFARRRNSFVRPGHGFACRRTIFAHAGPVPCAAWLSAADQPSVRFHIFRHLRRFRHPNFVAHRLGRTAPGPASPQGSRLSAARLQRSVFALRARAPEPAAWPSSFGVTQHTHIPRGRSHGRHRPLALQHQSDRHPQRAAQTPIGQGVDRGASHHPVRQEPDLPSHHHPHLAVRLTWR